MGRDWFYTKDGRSIGPVSSAALQALAKSGQLLSTDMVCTAGAQWTAASSIKGLFPTAQSTATTSSPSELVAVVNSPVVFDDENGLITKNHRSSPMGGNTFVDFLLLKRMISPWLLVIFYWLGLLGLIGIGLSYMVEGLSEWNRGRGVGSFLLGVISGLATIVLGSLLLRVYVELAIVIFRIHETLIEIRDKPR